MLTVRKVTPEDRGLLEEAAAADPFHAANGVRGAYWGNGNSLLWSDPNGPVVALRTTSVARIDIQFVTQNRKRNRDALLEGFWTYVAVLRNRGIEEVIVHTNSAAAMRFIEKRFHFAHLGGNEFSLRIKE